MAATAFTINLTSANGIKKINQQYLVKGHQIERKYSFNPIPHVDQRPLLSTHLTQRCFNKASGHMLSYSKRIENARHKNLMIKSSANDVATIEPKVEKEEEVSRATLLWRAAKLPMYTVALIPVTVATAAAYWQTGVYSSWRYFMILASYVLVNLWVNLSNDVYDFDTGVDVNKKESVVNLFGSRNGISILAYLLLIIGFGGLTRVALLAGNARALLLVASATFCFNLYQCPPFRLSYWGVGEPLLFLAYGPLSTIGFYLLHSTTSELPISSTIVWSSVLVGFTTALILFCSHFHQIKDDSAVGKVSPLVRLGTEKGSKVVKIGVIGLYALVLALGFTQVLPFASVLLCALTLPMGSLVIDFVEKNHRDNSKIFMGKYFCVRLHTIFGLALAAGLVIARKFAGVPVQDIPQAALQLVSSISR